MLTYCDINDVEPNSLVLGIMESIRQFNNSYGSLVARYLVVNECTFLLDVTSLLRFIGAQKKT